MSCNPTKLESWCRNHNRIPTGARNRSLELELHNRSLELGSSCTTQQLGAGAAQPQLGAGAGQQVGAGAGQQLVLELGSKLVLEPATAGLLCLSLASKPPPWHPSSLLCVQL